ncbi:hypothetical protein QUV94_02220 [Collinsella intestinalis]|nr:hypothetical protein [Collinsella intestinalis]
MDLYAILFLLLPRIVFALVFLVITYLVVRKAVSDELKKSGR